MGNHIDAGARPSDIGTLSDGGSTLRHSIGIRVLAMTAVLALLLDTTTFLYVYEQHGLAFEYNPLVEWAVSAYGIEATVMFRFAMVAILLPALALSPRHYRRPILAVTFTAGMIGALSNISGVMA